MSITATFTVLLNEASSSDITMQYVTRDGTALAGSDYISASGQITIPSGQISAPIAIVVTDNGASASRFFYVDLSNPSAGSFLKQTGTCTIEAGSASGSVLVVMSAPVTLVPTPAALTPLSASGNQLVDASGTKLRLNSVSWYGFDGSDLIVHGLYAGRGYKSILDQFRSLGFDSVRLPFCDDFIGSTLTFNDASGNQYVDGKNNPDLLGLTPMQALDAIVYYCSQIGMRVILDHHRISMNSIAPPASANNGYTWSDSGYGTDGWPAFDYAAGITPETGKYLYAGSTTPALYRPDVEWQAMWMGLATHFTADHSIPGITGAGQYASSAGLRATIAGFEPHNEPWQIPWGTWASMCESLFSSVNAIAPDWMMFVQGVGSNVTTTGPEATADAYWWGGYLKGVTARPINLGSAQNKLCYVVHDYGQSVSTQTWLSSVYSAGGVTTSAGGDTQTGVYPAMPNQTVPDYPNNIEAVYDAYWGFIYRQNIAPIWVGEFGGGFGYDYSTGAADPLQVNASFEVQWVGALVQYLNGIRNDGTSMIPSGGVGMSYAYFSLNPESGNPLGGLLENLDYSTVQVGKMKLIQPLLQGISVGAAE